MASPKKVKILVIGEKCLDVFVYGDCKRLCPEAPVPVFEPKKTETYLGCAGNVFENLKSIGGKEFDVDFINQFESYSDGLDEITSPNAASNASLAMTKTRYVDSKSGQLILRVDCNDFVPNSHRFSLSRFLNSGRKLSDYRAIVISDYGKGFLSKEEINQITSMCSISKEEPLVFLDTKFTIGPHFIDVDFVKINEKEYRESMACNPHPYHFCRNLIVTFGGDGCCIIKSGNEVQRFEPKIKREVRNVSGAGDTFFAAMVIKYLQTNDLKASLDYANIAAGIAVSRKGIVAVRKDEIENL
jgi:D-beta-D-heptose 7-phosphate kinase/D-beta-D-heptose 1-phosphate adenosyltransferase